MGRLVASKLMRPKRAITVGEALHCHAWLHLIEDPSVDKGGVESGKRKLQGTITLTLALMRLRVAMHYLLDLLDLLGGAN